MAITRRFPNVLRFAALSLIACSAFASQPWFRGGGSAGRGGGFHPGGGYHSGGGFRVNPGGFHGGTGFRVYGSVGVLPRGYATYRWGGSPWYMHGGHWYRPWRGAYVGCYPPVGLFVDVLPFGFTAAYYGGVRYYSYDDVYYLDAPSGGYTVADPPDRDEFPREAPPAPEHDALLVSPREGQSAERMKADRADAQRYARKVSGYDPAYSDPSDPGTPRARRAYHKALRSYLEQRGYSVD
ncbi:DUF6515 family protein [Mesoterricola silvestris]|uniref:Uncharacterized protein n=1 Tax=Mesoterricola silvestris TaxID=2927979 RepID=A0AA48GH95_9BACT|nr:DUF6515 family protein [Mesoterricola silvestris]BDU72836.1 hypothetical protein METEAL_20100 [Mesoterricola silvestris]